MPTEVHEILRIDASGRRIGSASRALGDRLIERLRTAHPNAVVRSRDLADGLPFVDESWIDANQTDPETRSEHQRQRLSLSDQLVGELQRADTLVLTSPIYNFSVPAVLKAWIDLVCRARLSFRYSADGPVGLLPDRPVYLALASGGTPVGSEVDFASGYLRHVLGFIGLHDLRLIAADQQMRDGQQSTERALRQLAQWLPVEAAA